MDYNKIIGANIRYERKMRNLTVSQFSEIIGITPGFLGLIERGHRGTTIENLCKIAGFFSIPVDTLLSRDVEDLAERGFSAPLDIKKEALKELIDILNDDELEFIRSTIIQLKKLRQFDDFY